MTSPNAAQTERLDFIQVMLERRHAYMAAAVLRLGVTHFTTDIDTAAVRVEGKEVRLLFNEKFFDSLNNKHLAAVLLHEAMHVLFRHPERAIALRRQTDRYLFNLACDAVVNDLITACFEDFELPSDAVTGQRLVGKSVHDKTAEEVVEMLRAGTPFPRGHTMDDHDVWLGDDYAGSPASLLSVPKLVWPAELNDMLRKIMKIGRRDPSFGLNPFGEERPTSPEKRPVRKNLERFLIDSISLSTQDETLWSRPPSRLISVYPQVILPSHWELIEWRIVIALDSSGSIPESFLTSALRIARQRIPNTKVTLLSFDTDAYEVPIGATSLKGGGGTRVQAVEDHVMKHMKSYPDYIFVLTDGFTSPPIPRYPKRWVWLLPAEGSTDAIPAGSRKEFFEA